MEKTKIGKYIVNYYINDLGICKCLERSKNIDIEYKTLFKPLYREKSNILDIGGFIGTTALLFNEIIDKNNKIYVFEPQYYDCLIKNITDNNLEKTILPYNCGLSNTNCFIPSNNIDINIQGNYGGRHLITLHDNNINNISIPNCSNTVELKKLDNFNFKDIGLIKICVEGFELLVLKGGIETIINNNYPPIFITIWGTDCWRNKKNTYDFYKKNKDNTINFLTELNYTNIYNNNDYYVFIHI